MLGTKVVFIGLARRLGVIPLMLVATAPLFAQRPTQPLPIPRGTSTIRGQVLDSISAQDVRIPANGRGDVRLRTRIGYDSIRSIWSEVVDVVRGERARYEIRGTAHYDTPAGRLSFPLTVYTSG